LDNALSKNSIATHAQELIDKKSAEAKNRHLSKEEVEKKIRESRKAMEAAAKDLDFIEAARLRDEIKSLRNQLQ
jgi:excinuclease ABC subunit B